MNSCLGWSSEDSKAVAKIHFQANAGAFKSYVAENWPTDNKTKSDLGLIFVSTFQKINVQHKFSKHSWDFFEVPAHWFEKMKISTPCPKFF